MVDVQPDLASKPMIVNVVPRHLIVEKLIMLQGSWVMVLRSVLELRQPGFEKGWCILQGKCS